MSRSLTRPIMILGGDGYLGWPLSIRLARANPSTPIILVDNLLRRRLVKRENGDSLLPILEPEQRLAACQEIFGLDNMEFVYLDVNSKAFDTLVGERKPAAVYHLAQQGSAPYSMRGDEQALFTLRNNEEGNLRLLWAVKKHVPDCHIVKLGSFGEYAISGLDVAEGYFVPSYRGKQAGEPVPYPREADDFYHASKINDTNYISVACRKWGLRVTDIMQCTVFGSWTPDIDDRRELFTRLDYDECFGTVANRFLAQAICGQALTVYGTGHQRTGLMSLHDTVQSLAQLWNQAPSEGAHRVINHLTEESYSVNELAQTIRELAGRAGFPVDIQRGVYDPRGEAVPAKLDYRIERRHVRERVKPVTLMEMVLTTLRMLMPYRERIKDRMFAPKTLWNDAPPPSAKDDRVVVTLSAARRRTVCRDASSNETEWERFRQDHFPYRHINLNPGTLGSPSRDVLEAMQDSQKGERLAHPLAQYRDGRDILTQTIATGERLWHTGAHALHIGFGATACSGLIALNLARLADRLGWPLRVITTAHEHIGGLGAFEKMPEFQIRYLSAREMRDPDAFKRQVAQYYPDIALFSHVAYDSGRVLPVDTWSAAVKDVCPHAWTLVDVSQSLGLLPPPFEHADVLFGSAHKWLFGPRGTGLLWTNERFRQSVGRLNWSGEPLLTDPTQGGFAPTGAMDFSTFAGLKAALDLHWRVGGDDAARRRSTNFCAFFKPQLQALLERHGIEHRTFDAQDGGLPCDAGMLAVSFPFFDPYSLYQRLDERMVHTKCIKDNGKNDRPRRLLRFGFPYYENEPRLTNALGIIEDCLGGGAKPIEANTDIERRTMAKACRGSRRAGYQTPLHGR